MTSSPKPSPKTKAFPQRSLSSSTCSNVDECSTPQQVILTAEELNALILPSTRFAFAHLATTILRLDFWDGNDPQSIFICKQAFKVIMSVVQLPEKTVKILKMELEAKDPTGDIAAMITSIKEDAAVFEHGPILLLGTLFMAIIRTGTYDSRLRVLLRHLSTLLSLCWDDFEELEDGVALTLVEEAYVESEKSKLARKNTEKSKKVKRYLMIGAAGGIGGVLIGLTGGLAAPMVASGASFLIGTGALAGLGTTAGAAILGTSFGVAGAGITGYKMKRRVGAIEEFSVEKLSEGAGFHCALVVSGWIDKDTQPELSFTQQWRHMRYAKEQYTLHYESKHLLSLGKAIDYLMGFAVSLAIQQTLMETALAGLLSAVAWPVAILSVASVLDNPWNVCVSRAAEVGEQLAEVLLSRSHGKRPISLVGFSMGARVIFHCLLVMSKRTDNVGILEDVILLGAPVTASPKQWAQVSTVVGGRLINGYCESDWILRFLYRTMSAQFSIAGVGPIDNKQNKKIFNYNLSHIIRGHMDYSRRLTEVLAAVGVRVSPHSAASEEELAALDAVEASQTIKTDGLRNCVSEVELINNNADGEDVGKDVTMMKKSNSDTTIQTHVVE